MNRTNGFALAVRPALTLAETLASIEARAIAAAEATPFGSDLLLLIADALQAGATTAARHWAELEAEAFSDSVARLQDAAKRFTGQAPRVPALIHPET